MNALVIAILLVLSAATLPAQTPGAAASVTYTSELGFSYSYASDWKDLSTTRLFEALNGMKGLLPKTEKENSRGGLATRATVRAAEIRDGLLEG